MLDKVKYFFARLAGSKLTSTIGLTLSILGALCVSNRADVVEAFGDGGVKWCARLALVGAFITAFGQGLGSRRPGAVDAGLAQARGIAYRGTGAGGERKDDRP